METNNHEAGENRLAVPVASPDQIALDIIRTETVLSKLPVHNLAKKGSISIQIVKKTESGEVELLWKGVAEPRLRRTAPARLQTRHHCHQSTDRRSWKTIAEDFTIGQFESNL